MVTTSMAESCVAEMDLTGAVTLITEPVKQFSCVDCGQFHPLAFVHIIQIPSEEKMLDVVYCFHCWDI